MKRIYLSCLLLCLFSSRSFSQTPDWSSQIANIIYNNCSSCHREGYIAPFTLMSYEDAYNNGFSIQTAVNAHIMPPWPPDPEYRHFANEAVLDPSEIDAINQWVDGGMPAGDLSSAPDPPAFNNGSSTLSSIDQTIQIPTYSTQYDVDEYRYFVIHSDYTETKYLNAIEIIPGNWSLVHHVDLYFDSTGHSFDLDQEDPLPGFNYDTGFPTLQYYVGGWSPGGNALKLPEKWGVRVPPGVDYVLEIHYAPGNQNALDSTRINFKFVTDTSSVRSVVVDVPIGYYPPSLTNPPLKIIANTVKSFYQESAPMPVDMSFISLSPHMHLIGRNYKIWYKTIEGDSIPLISIPDWNFHWQMYYMFPYVQKIPAGARIYGEAFYDNTANNPYNPNNPPITVKAGPYTTDEMLMAFMACTEYLPGDEDILLDSSIIATGIDPEQELVNTFQVYPNPSGHSIWINASLKSDVASLKITNALGQVVEYFPTLKISGGILEKKIDVTGFSEGIYLLDVRSDEDHFSTSILVLK
ncbi:MAG: T9SS type A sorting domain-containing protein [Chitinophagaceae bacterium]|nr:T9SS type A sorting domain-containing protein [Chitinophagaceae bacterium]